MSELSSISVSPGSGGRLGGTGGSLVGLMTIPISSSSVGNPEIGESALLLLLSELIWSFFFFFFRFLLVHCFICATILRLNETLPRHVGQLRGCQGIAGVNNKNSNKITEDRKICLN